MASSTPFLSQPECHEPNTPEDLLSPDEMMEQCIGGFGWAQFLQALLASLAWFFDGQQSFISDFTDAEPSWHCTNLGNETCDSSSNICDLSKIAWAWDGPTYKSIISEWALECASSFISGLPTSSFYMGCLLGGFILSTVADSKLGRKNMLFLTCLAMSIAAFVSAFSANIWMYSSLRFVSGFFRATLGTCALVLSTEIVGKRWRGPVGMMSFFFFSLGILSLPAMAYANKGNSWRTLYLWTSIPAILYCIIAYFFVSESPRWLILQGREEEAMAILKKITKLDQSSLNLYLSNMLQKQEKPNANLFSSMKSLFERGWALRRLLAVMTLSFGIGMMYYGMLLGVEDLGFDIYLTVTFNALMEIPSYFLAYFLIEKWNKKSSLLAFSIVSGICSIICAIVSDAQEGIKIGLELAAFLCTCIADNVLLIYAVELFPTSVRNLATTMVRQATVLAVVLVPILVAAGSENEFLSYGVFGLAIIFCGFFVLCLPETRGANLCDTMDEQELKENCQS